MTTPYTILPNDQVPPILAKYVWEDAETKIIGVFEWKEGDSDLRDPQFREWLKEHTKEGKKVGTFAASRWAVVYADLNKEIDTVA